MTKENLIKILNRHGHLKAADMPAEEKKRLYLLMEQYGATQSTTYNRFFDKGFDLWELQGIDQCKSSFISQSPHAAECLQKVGSGFYTRLTDFPGLKSNLANYMAERGMGHRNTVRKRFDADDWRQWERKGIWAIIEEFYAENRKAQTA